MFPVTFSLASADTILTLDASVVEVVGGGTVLVAAVVVEVVNGGYVVVAVTVVGRTVVVVEVTVTGGLVVVAGRVVVTVRTVTHEVSRTSSSVAQKTAQRGNEKRILNPIEPILRRG